MLRPDEEGLVVIHDATNGLRRNDGTSLKQSSTGNTHTVAAGSTTGVFTNTTFDGSTGSTGYTIGDLVKAMKTAGLLAA